MKRFIVMFALIACLGATGVMTSTASASNCSLSTTPAVESSLFGGPEVYEQMTFYNCSDVHAIDVRYQWNGTAADASGVDNYAQPFNFHSAKLYLGQNACGSNGIKPVPQPPPANAGVTFTCTASGTICGSLAAGCSMWGYTTSHWYTGCKQLVGTVKFRLQSYTFGTYGNWTVYIGPPVTVC